MWLTAIKGPDAEDADFVTSPVQNYIDVVFEYRFSEAPGGRLYPALIDATGEASGRNLWEWAPLKGSKGRTTARMTVTCPDA